MLEVLSRCWSERLKNIKWSKKLSELLPSISQDKNADGSWLLQMRERTDSILGF